MKYVFQIVALVALGMMACFLLNQYRGMDVRPSLLNIKIQMHGHLFIPVPGNVNAPGSPTIEIFVDADSVSMPVCLEVQLMGERISLHATSKAFLLQGRSDSVRLDPGLLNGLLSSAVVSDGDDTLGYRRTGEVPPGNYVLKMSLVAPESRELISYEAYAILDMRYVEPPLLSKPVQRKNHLSLQWEGEKTPGCQYAVELARVTDNDKHLDEAFVSDQVLATISTSQTAVTIDLDRSKISAGIYALRVTAFDAARPGIFRNQGRSQPVSFQVIPW